VLYVCCAGTLLEEDDLPKTFDLVRTIAADSSSRTSVRAQTQRSVTSSRKHTAWCFAHPIICASSSSVTPIPFSVFIWQRSAMRIADSTRAYLSS
jgi:hypothetical protein